MKLNPVKKIALGVTLAVAGGSGVSQASTDLLWLDAAAVSMSSSSNPINEQAGTPQVVEYGSEISGALGDGNDFIGSDGVTPYDVVEFTLPEAPKQYVITIHSAEFAGRSTLWYQDEVQQQFVPLQSAYVWAPDDTVQYSGTLASPGNYAVVVQSADGNIGGYTVSVREDLVSGGDCSNPDSENPFVESAVGVELSCTLTAEEAYVLNAQDGPHYAKPFHLVGTGSSLTINAASGEFTPLIVLFDPTSGQIIDMKPGTLTGQFTGDVYYLVTSAEPQAIGAFTVLVEEDQGFGGGFGTFAEPRSAFDLELPPLPYAIERK